MPNVTHNQILKGYMMLIKCIDCGAEISDVSIACPKCGNPTATVKKVLGLIFGTIITLIAAYLIALLILY